VIGRKSARRMAAPAPAVSACPARSFPLAAPGFSGMTTSPETSSAPLSPPDERASRQISWGAAIPRYALAAILLLVMLNLLAGVALRYAVVPIADHFDLPGVSFFWVEEVGEFGLAWLTAIGAAVAIVERTHFALHVFVHRLKPRTQRFVHRLNHLLIAGFGALVAYYGWQISSLNSMLESPGLGVNLAWLYASTVAGGTLTVFYGLAVAADAHRATRARLEDF
jgi:TRAP-type C4-dicarboxylate transport system permease small subunit